MYILQNTIDTISNKSIILPIDENSSLVPPDPIPNSEVKWTHADDSLAFAR